MLEALLKKILLKEDSHLDRKILFSALDAWEAVVKKFTDEIEGIEYIDEDSELLSNIIDTDLGVLSIEFTLDKNGQGYGNYQPSISKKEGGIDFICINLGNIFDLNEYAEYVKKLAHIEKTIRIKAEVFFKILHNFAVQNVFIHEFTHFYDDNTKYSILTAELKNKKMKNYDYYGDPHEKNAFYMTWIAKIIAYTYKKYNSSLKKLSPEQRLDFITNEWKNDKEFMSYYTKLDNKSKKRLLSRLYSYFSTDFYK